MKNIIFLFSLTILLFSSCKEDFFNTTLNIDPPPHTAQMAVSAVFTNTDTTLTALVGTSTGLLESYDFENLGLDNVSISLFREDELLTNFEHVPVGLFGPGFNYQDNSNVVLGDMSSTYSLKVSHPDYPEILTSTTMPELVPVMEAKVDIGGGFNEFGERTEEFTFEINDPRGIENFYEFAVIHNMNPGTNNFYSNPLYLISLDFNLRDSYGSSYVVSDETFDGKNYEFTLSTDYKSYREDQEQTYQLVWRTVSKDYYEFIRSAYTQRDSEDFGPFAEPVSIRSNIENGLGIFALKNEAVYDFVE